MHGRRLSTIYAVLALGCLLLLVMGWILPAVTPSVLWIDVAMLAPVVGTMIPAAVSGFFIARMIDQRRMRRLMVSGLLTGGICTAISVGYILSNGHPQIEPFARWIATPLGGWAAFVTYIAAVYHFTLTWAGAKWLRIISCVFALLLAAVVVVRIQDLPRTLSGGTGYRSTYRQRQLEEQFEQVTTIGGIALGASFLLMVGVAAVPRLLHDDVPDAERSRFTITCPRCGREQPFRTHGDHCTQCGLHVKVTPV